MTNHPYAALTKRLRQKAKTNLESMVRYAKDHMLEREAYHRTRAEAFEQAAWMVEHEGDQ